MIVLDKLINSYLKVAVTVLLTLPGYSDAATPVSYTVAKVVDTVGDEGVSGSCWKYFLAFRKQFKYMFKLQ